MTANKSPASLAHKIGCVVLLTAGVFILSIEVEDTGVMVACRFYAQLLTSLLLLLLAWGLMWIGARLWERWPTVLGVLFAVFGVCWVVLAYKSATEAPALMWAGLKSLQEVYGRPYNPTEIAACLSAGLKLSLDYGIILLLLSPLFLLRKYVFTFFRGSPPPSLR